MGVVAPGEKEMLRICSAIEQNIEVRAMRLPGFEYSSILAFHAQISDISSADIPPFHVKSKGSTVIKL